MIELQNITFSYNHLPILKDFNLIFPQGKNTVLIGPSGCGKSTILRLINGLLTAQHGVVLVDSEKINKTNIISMRRKMGYLIQQGGLFPHMTAEKNITLMARRLQWPPSQIKKRLNELLELTQLEPEMLKRYPVQLSGGQQQRVSLMRALMLNPDLMLLDEPFAALDPLIRNELQKSIAQIFKKLLKTVIWVTHDLNEAAFFGDNIVLLDRGLVIQSGSVEDLVRRPKNEFVKQFVSAQRSYLPEMKQ